MRKCSVCDYENDEKIIFCPICGNILEKNEILEPRRVFSLKNEIETGINKGAVITGLVMAFAGIILFGWIFGLIFVGLFDDFIALIIGSLIAGFFGFFTGYALSIKQQKRDKIIKNYQFLKIEKIKF